MGSTLLISFDRYRKSVIILYSRYIYAIQSEDGCGHICHVCAQFIHVPTPILRLNMGTTGHSSRSALGNIIMRFIGVKGWSRFRLCMTAMKKQTMHCDAPYIHNPAARLKLL